MISIQLSHSPNVSNQLHISTNLSPKSSTLPSQTGTCSVPSRTWYQNSSCTTTKATARQEFRHVATTAGQAELELIPQTERQWMQQDYTPVSRVLTNEILKSSGCIFDTQCTVLMHAWGWISSQVGTSRARATHMYMCTQQTNKRSLLSPPKCDFLGFHPRGINMQELRWAPTNRRWWIQPFWELSPQKQSCRPTHPQTLTSMESIDSCGFFHALAMHSLRVKCSRHVLLSYKAQKLMTSQQNDKWWESVCWCIGRE